MRRSAQAPVVFFAIGMIGLGILALVYRDFAEWGQLIGAGVPGRAPLVYASGLIMLLGGIGLLFKRTTALSARILFPFLVVGFLLQVPSLVTAPQIEVNWESAGELALLLSGGWVLFATGEKGLRMAQILFGLWLLPIALSHFAYLDHTVSLVPTWLPFRTGWVYLTGAAHAAAGLGVLFSILPRLAATLEAAMLGVFTLLVWAPRLVAAPTDRGIWTEFVVSWTIASAAWLVADSIPTKDPARNSAS